MKEEKYFFDEMKYSNYSSSKLIAWRCLISMNSRNAFSENSEFLQLWKAIYTSDHICRKYPENMTNVTIWNIPVEVHETYILPSRIYGALSAFRRSTIRRCILIKTSFFCPRIPRRFDTRIYHYYQIIWYYNLFICSFCFQG